MSIVGKSLEEAKQELSKLGVKNFEVKNNFVRPLEGSSLLVLSYKINGETAHITMGSFKLKI